MLDLRKRIFLGLGLPIILIILLFIFLIFRNSNKAVTSEPVEMDIEEIINNPPAVKTDDGVVIQGTQDNISEIATPQTIEEQEILYVKQLSRIFIERFLSYSNQVDNQNVEDVLTLATPKMQTWLATQTIDQSEQYEGVTTKVLSTELLEMLENTASVNISVQQEKMTLKTSENSQKSGKIDFIRDINGQWKVDGLFWE